MRERPSFVPCEPHRAGFGAIALSRSRLAPLLQGLRPVRFRL
ncbi:hypothetical protein GLE_0964 [Lysobacter enzymogenes]|uniref:Uncharacterized protein n=1 Tax=Lysobacter enzymogenes TaxID=69 RepID=A0A0S2DCQ5_LYSEN|nr:hypothetical protein GLE_0964 [Lysobacter enzymogenes]